MGRELKRVPLDFDWPLNQVWRGYVNPHYVAKECWHCDGTGCSPEARMFEAQWFGRVPFTPANPFLPGEPAIMMRACRNVHQMIGFNSSAAIKREAQRLCDLYNRQWMHHLDDDDVAALIAEDRLMDLTHTYDPKLGWQKRDPPVVPTADQVNIWSISVGIAHDAINRWVAINARCKREGVEPLCRACQGEGHIWPSDEAKARYDAWEREEPPAGDAYQVWETVSEGSPISPPFATPEELAHYLVANPWGGRDGPSYETWLAWIHGPGWAPSLVSGPKGITDGVTGIVAIG